MVEAYSGLAAPALLLCVTFAGWLAYRSLRQQKALRAMTAQSQWLITARDLVTPQEQEAWRWLTEVFPDHHVMLKIPVVRYTAPRDPGDGHVWHQRLSGIYCAFTVCGADGTVIGCADLIGPGDTDNTHCYFKETILGKCGIPYLMLRNGQLPEAQQLHAAFIGQIELTEMNSADPLQDGAPAPPERESLELTSVDPLAPAPVNRVSRCAPPGLAAIAADARGARGLPRTA